MVLVTKLPLFVSSRKQHRLPIVQFMSIFSCNLFCFQSHSLFGIINFIVCASIPSVNFDNRRKSSFQSNRKKTTAMWAQLLFSQWIFYRKCIWNIDRINYIQKYFQSISEKILKIIEMMDWIGFFVNKHHSNFEIFIICYINFMFSCGISYHVLNCQLN